MTPIINRRDALLGVMLATGGVAALTVRPSLSRPDLLTNNLETLLDRPVSGWRSVEPNAVITGPADELGAASFSELGIRMFEPERGPTITTLLAYSAAQTYATQLHRPELCYPASNFKVQEQRSLALTLAGRIIPATLMFAQRGHRTDAVLYWTRVGAAFPTELWGQRLEMARGTFTGRRNDELLARFSVTGWETATADSVIRDFVTRFVEAQTLEGKRLLLG